MSAQVSAEEDHRLARKRRTDRIQFDFDFDAIFPANSSGSKPDETSTSADSAVSSTPIPISSAPNQNLHIPEYREQRKRKRQEDQNSDRAPVPASSRPRTQYADEPSPDKRIHIHRKRSKKPGSRTSVTTGSRTLDPVHFLSLPFEIRDKIYDAAVLLSSRYASFNGEMLRFFVEFYCRKRSEVKWNELDAVRMQLQHDAESFEASENGKSRPSSLSSDDKSGEQTSSFEESSDHDSPDTDADCSPIHDNK